MLNPIIVADTMRGNVFVEVPANSVGFGLRPAVLNKNPDYVSTARINVNVKLLGNAYSTNRFLEAFYVNSMSSFSKISIDFNEFGIFGKGGNGGAGGYLKLLDGPEPDPNLLMFIQAIPGEDGEAGGDAIRQSAWTRLHGIGKLIYGKGGGGGGGGLIIFTYSEESYFPMVGGGGGSAGGPGGIGGTSGTEKGSYPGTKFLYAHNSELSFYYETDFHEERANSPSEAGTSWGLATGFSTDGSGNYNGNLVGGAPGAIDPQYFSILVNGDVDLIEAGAGGGMSQAGQGNNFEEDYSVVVSVPAEPSGVFGLTVDPGDAGEDGSVFASSPADTVFIASTIEYNAAK